MNYSFVPTWKFLYEPGSPSQNGQTLSPADDLHELTFSCYRRMPLLTNDVWWKRLGRFVDEALAASAMQLVTFVFMPEHVHLVVDPLESEPNIGGLLAKIKQPFSHDI